MDFPNSCANTSVDCTVLAAEVCRSAAMTGYQYRQLSGQSGFRLLLLKDGQWESDLICELRHDSLESPQRYEALSYVWGEPELAASIYLDGHVHHVTINLHAALKHLRLVDLDRVLWVDALCINQRDLEERSIQVLAMHTIYNKSVQVLSWLGDGSRESDEAMHLIEELGQWSKANQDDLMEALATENTTSLEVFETMGFPMTSRNWLAFWDIFNRPYWTRVWIIQELAASGNLDGARGTIICGTSAVDRKWFDYTCAAMLLIVFMGKNIKPGVRILEEPMRSMLIKGHPPGLSMSQMQAACKPVEPVTMEWLLRLSSRFVSTEKRDKIYSLLGLVCEEHRAFVPDYSKPLRLVLQELVQFLVRVSGNLGILSGNRFSINSDGPSWTPILAQQMQSDSVLSVKDTSFSASAGQPPVATFDLDSEMMTVRGFVIGRVKTVIGPFKPAYQLPANVEAIEVETQRLGIQKLLQDFAAFGRKLAPKDEETFWRTIVMDKDFAQDTDSAPAEFADLYRVFVGTKPVPTDFLPDAPMWVRVGEFSRPFHTTMDQTTMNRCFFATEDGRMGLGPYCTQAEDVIVLLLGSPVCHVLREIDSHYCLVGDAYVHGMMHGEAVRGKTEQESQDFVLV